MFKNPHLQQVIAYSWCAEFDMCEVGELRDPVTQQLMKKGMQVITTSERMFRLLHGRRCSRNHEHQQIEGSTIYKGQTVSIIDHRFPRITLESLHVRLSKQCPKYFLGKDPKPGMCWLNHRLPMFSQSIGWQNAFVPKQD